MSAYLLALGALFFVPQVWAGPAADLDTGIGRVLASPSDLSFMDRFEALSESERRELMSALFTRMAGWEGASQSVKALAEGNALKFPLAQWLDAELAEGDKDPERLHFVAVARRPALTKIKFEKGRCISDARRSWLERFAIVPDAKALGAQTADLPPPKTSSRFWRWVRTSFCTLSKKYLNDRGCVASLENAGQMGDADEVETGFSPHCNRELRISLVAEFKSDEGTAHEEAVLSTNVHNFRQGPAAKDWSRWQREIWLALERLYTPLEAFNKTLPQRMRVVELLNAQPEKTRLLHWQKLAVYLQSLALNADAAAVHTDKCALVQKFYTEFSEQALAPSDLADCPKVVSRKIASETPLDAATLGQAQVSGAHAEGQLYRDQLKRTLLAGLEYARKRGNASASVSAPLSKNILGALDGGLTSELMSQMLSQFWASNSRDSFDVAGEAARLVIGRLPKNSGHADLHREQLRLQKIVDVFDALSVLRGTSLAASAAEREWDESFALQKNIAQALLRELAHRL